MDQSRQRRLLVAVTPMGYEHVKRSVQDGFRLVPAFSMADAIASVKQGEIDAVLCGLHFEDSGMFDLLREVRKLRPSCLKAGIASLPVEMRIRPSTTRTSRPEATQSHENS